MDMKPARSEADWPCIALLKAASREWFSVSRAIGAIFGAFDRSRVDRVESEIVCAVRWGEEGENWSKSWTDQKVRPSSTA